MPSFAGVRLEDENEQESCVVRLGDLRARSNKMDNWNWERFLKVKDTKDETREREMLDAQMKRLVKTIRKDQGRKPNNESTLEKFEAVVEELGKESLLPSEQSLEEPSWDMHALMKQQKAKYEYVKIAEANLRKKLVRLGRIKHEGELDALDSIIESAYNSKKQLLWGQMEAPFQVPQPSLESGEAHGLFGDSDVASAESSSSEHD